jgi:outer membrane murein-binding lipoprotein Lpp
MPLVGLRLGISMLVCLAAGCASDRDAIDRRLEGLSEDITRLQATNDRLLQRVDQLEVERASRRDAKAPTPAPQLEHAPLKVVKLEPESTNAAAPPTGAMSPAELPDAPGDRPVIRLRGRSDGKADSKSDDKTPAVSVRVVDEGAAK